MHWSDFKYEKAAVEIPTKALSLPDGQQCVIMFDHEDAKYPYHAYQQVKHYFMPDSYAFLAKQLDFQSMSLEQSTDYETAGWKFVLRYHKNQTAVVNVTGDEAYMFMGAVPYDHLYLKFKYIVNDKYWAELAGLFAELAQTTKQKYSDYFNKFASDENPAAFTPSLGDTSEGLPGLNHTVTHPVSGDMSALKTVIINLNDIHQWTREQIADWLDEISDPTGLNGPDLRFSTRKPVVKKPISNNILFMKPPKIPNGWSELKAKSDGSEGVYIKLIDEKIQTISLGENNDKD